MTTALGGANAAVVVARAASAIVDDTKVKQMAGDIIQCLAATVLRRNRRPNLEGTVSDLCACGQSCAIIYLICIPRV